MGSDQDRAPKGPVANAFFDDAGVRSGARPPPRARRPKPPPGIITAGGVDMARAHASGIVVREQRAPDVAKDEPRVVIAVETDARKVPTHPRLIEPRASAGATAADAPGEATIVRHAESAPRDRAQRSRGAAWARAFTALVLLSAVVLLAREARPPSETLRITPRVLALLHAVPQPPPPREPPTSVIAIEDLPAATPEPSAPSEPRATKRAPSPRARRAPPAPPGPGERRAPPARPEKPAPAADKAPAFLPPFELPQEKSRD
jgi:hypothetical protein